MTEAWKLEQDPAVAYQTPTPAVAYETPTIEVISLDCEISSYAPDDSDQGDAPLF